MTASTGAGPRAVAVGLVAFGLFVAGFLLFGALGWPGTPDSCTLPEGNCYCEAPAAPATVGKQPLNTWSNLGAVVAGLVILAIAERDRRRREGASRSGNPMTAGGPYALAYGAVVLALGPGSMAFHGSLTRVGGWLDTLSMILFITFVLVYNLARVLRRDDDPATAAIGYVGLNSVLAALTWVVPGTGVLVFALVVVGVVGLELAIAHRGLAGVRRARSPWLPAALGVFLVALAIWWLSWTGGPLCDPDSLLQGHAVWHVLAEAVVPLLLFAHLRTETRTSSADPA